MSFYYSATTDGLYDNEVHTRFFSLNKSYSCKREINLVITHKFSCLKPINKVLVLLTSLRVQKMRQSDVKERARQR